MILLVSPEEDRHTKAMRRCLEQMGAAITLLDLAEFPQQAQVAMKFGANHECYESVMSNYERELNLSDYRSVWWRHSRPFVLHPELTDQIYRSFAYVECHAAISGLWLALDAFWVNHPMRSEEALRRPYQLKIAQQAGLAIPATLITNNPNRARAFIQQHGPDRTIYRAFSTTAKVWREAQLVQPQQMALLDNVCYAPVLFQEYIPPQIDLRIIAVGDALFAASALTWEENDAETDMAPYRLSPTLAAQVQTLMARLGLSYGVLHMRITAEGQPVFLELNPAGDWLAVEDATQMPITKAVAQLLMCREQAHAPAYPAMQMMSS